MQLKKVLIACAGVALLFGLLAAAGCSKQDDAMEKEHKILEEIGGPPPASLDQKALGALVGYIGNESCVKCHFVHLPAQTAKDTWAHFADVLK